MKRYILLRNNQEFGPFSFQEIQRQELKPQDLVWIEGISTSWAFAGERDELNAFVKKESIEYPLIIKRRPAVVSRTSDVCLPSYQRQDSPQPAYDFQTTKNNRPHFEVKFKQSPNELKELPVQNLKEMGFRFERNHSRSNGLWIPGLVGCLLIGAFFIKKIVDGSPVTPTDTSAMASPLETSSEATPPKGNFYYQNALSSENVHSDTEPIRSKKQLKPVDFKK